MNVDAEIILEKSENTLCIPVGALMRGNRVYVKKEAEDENAGTNAKTNAQSGIPTGFVAVQVETGVVNEDYVEILSGLAEGDEVYIDASTGTVTNMFQMGGMPGGNMGSNVGGMPGGNMGGSMGGMPGGNRGGNMGSRP